MDFFSLYLSFTDETESPKIYHRWCAITAIGALLGRRKYLRHGHFRIFPNLYVQFIGDPGSRKSAAIKLSRRLIRDAEYTTFASSKTSGAQFFVDLEGDIEAEENEGGDHKRKKVYDATMHSNLWGSKDANFQEHKEVFIMADEWNEFFGTGTVDFYTDLGSLWDWDDPKDFWKQRFKNSKKVEIYQPTISIIGGNTQELFARAFPPEMLGTGFLSRMLLIYGERTDKKIAFPEPPPSKERDEIVELFKTFRLSPEAALPIAASAKGVLEKIYKDWDEMDDVRFKGYSNRRFSHLLKLCIIHAVGLGKTEVDVEAVIYTNTVLNAAERLMPRALGEFGKSKNSDVANRIMEIINTTDRPLKITELFTQVHQDVNKVADLSEIINNLALAGKIQMIQGAGGGILPKRKMKKDPAFVNWDLLSDEERKML